MTAAILCGGQGRRLGNLDKASISFRGQRLIDRISLLAERITSKVIWVEKEPHRLSSTPGRVYHRVGDHSVGGAVGALLSALNFIHHQASHGPEDTHNENVVDHWCLVLACDLPLITPHELQSLTQSIKGASSQVQCIALSMTQTPQPLCACWRSSAASLLLKHCEEGGRLTTFVERFGITLPIEEFGSTGEVTSDGRILSPLFNLNTFEDLSSLQNLEERYDHSSAVLQL